MSAPHPDKRLLSIDEACHVLGLGRTSIYAAIKRAEIRPLKCGRRTLVLAIEIEAFISKLKAEQPLPEGRGHTVSNPTKHEAIK